jgi:hypothetical protein
MQKIFPKIPPMESSGMNIPPGNPVALDIIVSPANMMTINMLLKRLKLLLKTEGIMTMKLRAKLSRECCNRKKSPLPFSQNIMYHK